jgi:hypothetical protein
MKRTGAMYEEDAVNARRPGPKAPGGYREGQSGARDRNGDESPLAPEIVYFATGVTQHIFMRTDHRAARCVYKIPAAFGDVLPLADYLRESPALTRRARLSSSAIAAILDRTPPARRVIAAHLRRKRAREFDAMIDVLTYLSRVGASRSLLPYRVSRNKALTLRIGSRRIRYEGPVLVQARATFLRADNNPFACDWRGRIARDHPLWAHAVIAAQHRLWKHGVGIADKTEILGPSDWALWRHELRLGDTGNLTRDFQRVHDALDAGVLRQRIDDVIARFCSSCATPAAEYFRAVEREINQPRLIELWGTSAGDPRQKRASSDVF